MKIIAHRGGSLEKPENTIESIIYSINNNFDGLEIDIQFTKDNIPIIIHNPYFENIIFENTLFNDLLKIKKKIIKLETALELIKGKKMTFFEIKGTYSKNKMDILNEMFINYGNNYGFNFYLASFNSLFLENCDINIKKMFITFNILPKDIFIELYNKIKFESISMQYDFIDLDILDFCKKNNIFVYVWTINHFYYYQKFELYSKDNMIDGIITDRPLTFYNIFHNQVTINNLKSQINTSKIKINKQIKKIPKIKTK